MPNTVDNNPSDDSEKQKMQRVVRYDEAFTPPSEEIPIAHKSQSPVERISEAFLRFNLSILQNYRSYLIFPNKDTPEYMGFKTRQFILSQIYDHQPYLRLVFSSYLSGFKERT